MTEAYPSGDLSAMPVESDTAASPVDERPWLPFWEVMVLGLTSVLFGLALLAWPDASVRVLAILMGVWFMVTGAARVVAAFFSGRGIGRQLFSGIIGIVFVMGGAACLRDVARGVLVLALMIAVAWIFSGIAELVFAFRTTGMARSWLVALAAVSIMIGFAFLLWPHPSLTVMIILTGVSALILGVGELAFAFQIRRTMTAA